VEGCGSGGGRGPVEGPCGEGACVGLCRSSWQWPWHTLGRWQHNCIGQYDKFFEEYCLLPIL